MGMATHSGTTGRWRLRDSDLRWGERTLLMGILNVTPDSFSDGGRYLATDAAVARALELEREGADILDVGGESTRPGSDPVDPAEEERRVVPVIAALRGALKIPISIDTRRASVAQAALAAGARIVNDVSALADPLMASLAARERSGLVLMHMRGEPKTMQRSPAYADVVIEVREFLRSRAALAMAAGVSREAIAVDPGLGFGKRTGEAVEDNAALLKRLDSLTSLGFPVLVGASRKAFIGNAMGGAPVDRRLEGSLAAAAVAAWQGAAIVRAHDVAATRSVLDVVDAVRRA